LAKPPVEERVPEFDEFAVVEAARRGSQAALAELYEHYFPKIYRFVVVRLGSEDAEDVTTEVFLRVIDNIGGFTWRGLPFGAWIFRIARNEVVSHVRKQKVRANTTQLSDGISDDGFREFERIENALTVEAIHRAAEGLPEAQRQVIALRFGAGLTVAETARALNKTENNVKVLQHKGIAKLQQMVKDQ
jgi:RNA polymerase sigma-70 factor (ECF subfamily)